MRLFKILVVLFLLQKVMAQTTEIKTYYVSPSGRINGEGTLNDPFKTIDDAQLHVQKELKSFYGKIVVSIMPGQYWLNKPLEFDETDCGDKYSRVIYKGSGKPGDAKLIGGMRITGWKKVTEKIYKTIIPDGIVFNTLYENGNRAYKARYPNLRYDNKYPLAQADYLESKGPLASQHQVIFDSTDIPLFKQSSHQLEINLWDGPGYAWFTTVKPVKEIDFSKRIITIDGKTRYTLFYKTWLSDKPLGCRYFLQNSMEFLDQAGEFYFDFPNHELYYIPYSLPIENQEIIVPLMKNIISIKGKNDSTLVSNLEFDGLELAYTDFTNNYRFGIICEGEEGNKIHKYPFYDKQVEIPEHRVGAIYLQNTYGIVLKNLHIKNIGYSGIFLNLKNIKDSISNTLIEKAGHSGIYFHGGYPGEGNSTRQNVVDNCKINIVGEMVGNSSGIYLLNSSENTISQCSISNSARIGIMWGAWPYIPKEDVYVYGNTMKNLRITKCCQNGGDTAPLYAFGLSGSGGYNVNTVENVIIDSAYCHPSSKDQSPHGVYMDLNADGQVFKNVWVKNIQSTLYFGNHTSGHVITNVSWEAGFDSTKIDVNSISITANFPKFSK